MCYGLSSESQTWLKKYSDVLALTESKGRNGRVYVVLRSAEGINGGSAMYVWNASSTCEIKGECYPDRTGTGRFVRMGESLKHNSAEHFVNASDNLELTLNEIGVPLADANAVFRNADMNRTLGWNVMNTLFIDVANRTNADGLHFNFDAMVHTPVTRLNGWEFDGGNCIIEPTNGYTGWLIGGRPANQQIGVDEWVSNRRYDWHHFNMVGNANGLDFSCSYGGGVHNAAFNNMNEGLRYAFGMNGKIDHNMFSKNHISMQVVNETLGGTATTAMQSNSTSITNNRIYGKQGGQYGIFIEDCSGIGIENLIIEGGQLQHGLYFTEKTWGNNVKDFHARRIHIERQELQSAMFINLMNGIADIDGIYSQYPNKFLFSSDNIGNNTSHYSDFIIGANVWWTPGTQFGQGTDTAIHFKYSSGDMSNPTRWFNGTVDGVNYNFIPSNITQLRRHWQ